MKDRKEYEQEYNEVVMELQQVEQRKTDLTTRAVELQGILKELMRDEGENSQLKTE